MKWIIQTEGHNCDRLRRCSLYSVKCQQYFHRGKTLKGMRKEWSNGGLGTYTCECFSANKPVFNYTPLHWRLLSRNVSLLGSLHWTFDPYGGPLRPSVPSSVKPPLTLIWLRSCSASWRNCSSSLMVLRWGLHSTARCCCRHPTANTDEPSEEASLQSYTPV